MAVYRTDFRVAAKKAGSLAGGQSSLQVTLDCSRWCGRQHAVPPTSLQRSPHLNPQNLWLCHSVALYSKGDFAEVIQIMDPGIKGLL